MELGQLLKQARLDAGLSQRQLCGDVITRNMLSQIENGSARPSMDTLRYLAARLEKPVSFFLQEASASPNQARLTAAREAYVEGDLAGCAELLSQWASPDAVADPERWLLELLLRLAMAEDALEQERLPYALTLLAQAAEAEEKTPYATPELHRRRLLLQTQTQPERRRELLRQLPRDEELILRAADALDAGEYSQAAALLDCDPREDPQWYRLRGDCAFAAGDYEAAAGFYLRIEDQALRRLEQCYQRLGDYKKAYEYACKQR